MKDRRAWNDRGSKGVRQGVVTWLLSLNILASANRGTTHRSTASESGKTYSQDTGENPP
jgi:hypothetical protein